LVIGGIPDVANEKVDYAIEIPGFLSFLAHGDFKAEVIGLDQYPRELWPPVLIVHVAFQVMVVLGVILMTVGLLFLLFKWKWPHLLNKKWWLVLVFLCTPLGFIAVEAGWVVTEVGRQPWIIYEIMKTEDALTPMPGLQYPFFIITAVYLLLSFLVIWLLSRQIHLLHQKY
jgi:cytochrome d ubiquinol oxidase subunit I